MWVCLLTSKPAVLCLVLQYHRIDTVLQLIIGLHMLRGNTTALAMYIHTHVMQFLDRMRIAHHDGDIEAPYVTPRDLIRHVACISVAHHGLQVKLH